MKKYFILLLVLGVFFFSNLSNTSAAEIHSFSINNEDKYFIYYWGGLNASTIVTFRNEFIKTMPLVEKWGGISFTNIKIVIVPESFEEYQAVYKDSALFKNTRIEKLLTKELYGEIHGVADSLNKIFLIKESGLGAIPHEASHLIQYPFSFDLAFSEGQANNAVFFITNDYNESGAIDWGPIGKNYDRLSPEEKIIYNRADWGDDLFYPVGSIFIEKLMNTAGVKNLSGIFTTLRNDFPDVGTSFNNPVGQELVMCEFIKTYVEKVESVFIEYGYPPAVICDAKIEKIKEIQVYSRKTKGSNSNTQETNVIPEATEQDPFVGSEIIENKKSEVTETANVDESNDKKIIKIDNNESTGKRPDNNVASSLIWILIILTIAAIAGGAYYFLKIKKKINEKETDNSKIQKP